MTTIIAEVYDALIDAGPWQEMSAQAGASADGYGMLGAGIRFHRSRFCLGCRTE